jgi:hypothetical protein
VGAAGLIFFEIPADGEVGNADPEIANPQSSWLRDKSITCVLTRNSAASSRRLLGAVARHSLGGGAIDRASGK